MNEILRQSLGPGSLNWDPPGSNVMSAHDFLAFLGHFRF